MQQEKILLLCDIKYQEIQQNTNCINVDCLDSRLDWFNSVLGIRHVIRPTADEAISNWTQNNINLL